MRRREIEAHRWKRTTVKDGGNGGFPLAKQRLKAHFLSRTLLALKEGGEEGRVKMFFKRASRSDAILFSF